MSLLISIIFLTLTALSSSTLADQNDCNQVFEARWSFVGSQTTLAVCKSTSINSAGTTMSSNANITALTFGWNKKIFFLTVQLAESFPNLVVLHASGCSITSVVKQNFNRLQKLRRLDLDLNKIRKIPNDAFQDLISLEWLQMGK